MEYKKLFFEIVNYKQRLQNVPPISEPFLKQRFLELRINAQ